MNIETLVVGQMATNCYIVTDNDESIIIDPGDDAEYISSHIKSKPKLIVATHGHFDHIMAAYALQTAYNIPFYMHELDAFLLSAMQSSAKHFLGLRQVDPPPRITGATQSLSVIHTPGHTPGSICLKFGGDLIVGDTMFAKGAVGRTDFSYSDRRKLTRSITQILQFPGETRILSGHGEETTVSRETRYHKN